VLTFIGTAFSGWMAAIAFVAAALLAITLREFRFAAIPGFGTMRTHYALGFGVPAIAFIHAWIPMATGRAGSFERIGLWIATLALLLLFVQMMLGMSLRSSSSGGGGLRRIHIGMMVVLAALILTHITLDRA
jgi:hypothetical protein